MHFVFFIPNCSERASRNVLNNSGEGGVLVKFLISEESFQFFTTEHAACWEYMPSIPSPINKSIMLTLFLPVP